MLGNWGLCALELERDGEAIWAYSEYLKKGGSEVDAAERKDLQRDLLLLDGNAATLNLSSSAPTFEVLDARAGSAAPPQSYKAEAGKLSLRLRAGTHTLTASHRGRSVRWEVALSPGSSEEHVFEFGEPSPAAPPALPVAAPVVARAPVAAAPAPAASQPATPAAPAHSAGTLRLAGYVTAGVGVVALGTAAILGVSAKKQDEDARAMCRDGASGLLCPDSAQSKFDSAHSQGSAATVLMVGGGVVAAAGVGMIVFGGPSHSEQATNARLRFTSLFSPSQLGLRHGGHFELRATASAGQAPNCGVALGLTIKVSDFHGGKPSDQPALDQVKRMDSGVKGQDKYDATFFVDNLAVSF